MKIIRFLLVLCLYLIIPGSIYAQNINLSMTPPLIETIIKPDTSIVIAYTLTNSGDPGVFMPYVRPFVPKDTYGGLVIADEFSGPIRFNLENSNIKLEEPFFLKTGQSQQLLLKVRVPQGTPEGDYYYSFLSQNVPGKLAEGGSQSIAQGAIGANVLISVTSTGVFESNAHISQLRVQAPYEFNFMGKKVALFESTDPVPVQLIVQNSGKSLIKPEGQILLTGTFGADTAYNVLPENILAQSSRLIHATPSGSLNNNEKTSFVIEGFHLGKYVVSASLNFGNKNQVSRVSTTFYAIPIKLMLATFAAIIIGMLIIKRFTTHETAVVSDEDEL